MPERNPIILYGSSPHFGLPEASPYVTKTEVQLKMAGLAYRKAAARPDDSPKGQIPFIEDEGERIADSTFIRAHLERKHGIDLDAGLAPRERAEAWAIERMIENHLQWTAAYHRWLIPENFAKGPSHFFDGAPPEMREQVLARVRANVFASGIGRHREAEIVELAGRSLRALSDILGDRPWLMGERPCGTDAVAFSMLAGLVTPFFESPLRQRAVGFDNLVAYVDRLMHAFYPEFPWTSGIGDGPRDRVPVCAKPHIAAASNL